MTGQRTQQSEVLLFSQFVTVRRMPYGGQQIFPGHRDDVGIGSGGSGGHDVEVLVVDVFLKGV